jgi:peptidyl-prolyl cis-trans isomerase C
MVSKVNAAHILVKTEKEALDLQHKLKNGGKFSDLAKKSSQCPSGKSGGELGWFEKGQMDAAFEKAAFEGKKGSIVGPVKTKFGYHLIFIKDQK